MRVTDVLELLAAGASFEEILADYPFLEREDIYAAIGYAARQSDHAILGHHHSGAYGCYEDGKQDHSSEHQPSRRCRRAGSLHGKDSPS